MGKERDAYSVLIRKPEGCIPFGIFLCVWEDDIKIDLNEIERKGVGWIYLAQNLEP
jgi:hypothetical protein